MIYQSAVHTNMPELMCPNVSQVVRIDDVPGALQAHMCSMWNTQCVTKILPKINLIVRIKIIRILNVLFYYFK